MRIERRLRTLAAENQSYAPLLAQWEFDKRLLSRALNTVSNNFPNFSLHDESHSSTIISQIEKVISPNIELLSATDCWLILESCYWHDSGMIINYEEKKQLVSDKNFIIHLKTISKGNDEFSEYAKSILEGVTAGNAEKLFDDSQYLTFILADYYRAKHASRSEEHVNNPIKIGVDSPRTPLIPRRLISILASICASHGKDSNSILILPDVNDGMDSEDYAHPRYVSALLRIGDLLDIDDGRFCPTLLKNIGCIPCSSMHHKEKHESIKSLYIDSSVISIRAECRDYDVFKVQQSWFDYIKSEFDFQKRHWNKIVPSSDYSALPTVNDINCVMLDFITLDGKVPTITLDSGRIYNYLTSQLLYESRFSYIRELIQNSMDAVYYKVWEEMSHKEELDNLQQHEQRDLFYGKINNERININLIKKEDIDSHYIYQLEIKDDGIGMSLDDIKKLTVVGSINKSLKSQIINSMQEWAKPSGYFGIGIQSVFDSVEKMLITTRQRGDLCYEIKLIKNGSRIPSVWIRVIDNKWFEGTSVTLEIKQEKIPNSVSMVESIDSIIYNYDPLVDTDIPVTESYISNAINKAFKNSTIPLCFNNETIVDGVKRLYKRDNVITDYKLGVDVLIDVDLENAHGKVYYKDTYVEDNVLSRGIAFTMNIFSKDSGYWLTVNRDKVRKDRLGELGDILKRVIDDNHALIYSSASDEKKAVTAFFIKGMLGVEYEGWEKYSLGGVVAGKYINGEESIYIVENSNFRSNADTDRYVLSYDMGLTILSKIVRLLGKKVIVNNISKVAMSNNFNDVTTNEVIQITVVNEFPKGGGLIYPLDELITSLKDYFSNTDKYMSRGRDCIVCYDVNYIEYSLTGDELPAWLASDQHGRMFFDNFLILPSKKGNSIEKEIDIVVEYYHKINKIVDKVILGAIYRKVWSELELYPKEI